LTFPFPLNLYTLILVYKQEPEGVEFGWSQK